MTIDERTVTTALQTYARGIDVTDADLERLKARLDARLDPTTRQSGRRPWEWVVAACAVLAVVLAMTALWRTRAEEAVPATPTPPAVTPADLTGLWMVDALETGGWLWHFTADGRAGFSNTPGAYLRVNESREPYVLEGDRITIPADGARCHATVRVTSEGRMMLTPLPVADQCDVFLDGSVWDFVRVSPASVAGRALVESPNAEDERPPTEPKIMGDVVGVWLFRGTGTVLVVEPSSPREGKYSIDDDGDGVEPDQRGTLVLSPDGGLVLRPSGAEEGCDTVFSRVVTTGVALELELAESSCGRLGAQSGTWVRLS